MARVLHNNGLAGYDTADDNWYFFDSEEKGLLWQAEFEPTPDYGPAPETQTHTISVAPAFNAFSIGVTCPAAPAVYGPMVNLCQGDEGRYRVVINAIIPAGSYLLIGSREGVSSGQGFPLQLGVTLELRNVRPVYAVLALGSATGPLTGTVGVLTESLVG